MILAAVHSGELAASCRDCQDDPEMKLTWGCDEPTQIACWVDNDEDEWYICPAKLITNDVIEWYREYSYRKNMGAARDYYDCTEQELYMMETYERYLGIYQLEHLEKSKKPTGPRLVRGD